MTNRRFDITRSDGCELVDTSFDVDIEINEDADFSVVVASFIEEMGQRVQRVSKGKYNIRGLVVLTKEIADGAEESKD